MPNSKQISTPKQPSTSPRSKHRELKRLQKEVTVTDNLNKQKYTFMGMFSVITKPIFATESHIYNHTRWKNKETSASDIFKSTL